jgi:hypothetical protein
MSWRLTLQPIANIDFICKISIISMSSINCSKEERQHYSQWWPITLTRISAASRREARASCSLVH